MSARAAILVLVAAASVSAASASAARVVSRAQLALMPLPKQSLGARAAGLPLDPSSGVVTNADAADNASPGVTAATFDRLGRITGYALDYNDAGAKALTGGHGLIDIETSVELYRSARAAQAGIAFRQKDDAKLATLKLSGVSFTLGPLHPPQLGDRRFGYSLRAKLSGKPPFYGAEVVVQAGPLVAMTSVSAADRATPAPLASELSKRLQARISAVLAGKVGGPPVTLPGKLKAGPPPSGLDLSALALRPSDLSRATVTHQGYQLDKDLSPISEYARSMSPAGTFAFLDQEVALFHSPTEASFTIGFLTSALSSADFLQSASAKDFKPAHISSLTSKPVRLRAGDESRAVLVTVKLSDGQTVDEGFVLLRVGSTTQFIVVATAAGTPLLPSALGRLAQTAVERARAGLHT